MIVFLDESGDLGFDFEAKQPSRFFTITLLVCDDRRALAGFRKAVRRTLKNKLNRRKSRRRVQELHGSDTALTIKRYFARQMPDRGWQLYSVTLNKQRVQPHLTTRGGKKKLYNFLARFLLEQLPLEQATENVSLVVDKSKNTEEIRDFNQYLQNQLEALLPLNTALHIHHDRSQDDPGLQAVDLFCWGLSRKHERGDGEWYEYYRRFVAFETIYLP